jgi:exonuclease VII large subunit
MAAIIVCIGMFAAVPARAQSSAAPTSQDTVSQHHQLQYRMMNEMTQEMTRMTEQMSRGELSPEENKKMGEQMSRMAKLMLFMSGLAARPAHNHAQLQKQMDQMRAQMSEMMSNSQMAPGAR